jgi:S1-C subfamily serine protease
VALYVIGTEHVSDASLDALRKALPTVKIERRSEALFGVDVAKHPQGVEIVNVLPGSPADRAGIRSGDVLVEFAGEAVPSSDSLQRVMLPLKAGQKVTAKLERGSQTLSVVVLLEEWN